MKLPEKHISITFSRSPEEIVSLLKSRLRIGGYRTDYVFEGKVNPDNSFTLQQLFDYGPRNSLRPLIKGRVAPTATGSMIEITYSLPADMAALLFAALLINSVIAGVLLFKQLLFYGFGLIGTMVLFLLIAYGTFDSKVAGCSRVLRSIVQ